MRLNLPFYPGDLSEAVVVSQGVNYPQEVPTQYSNSKYYAVQHGGPIMLLLSVQGAGMAIKLATMLEKAVQVLREEAERHDGRDRPVSIEPDQFDTIPPMSAETMPGAPEPVPEAPVKRKRGRPPKVRPEVPPVETLVGGHA